MATLDADDLDAIAALLLTGGVRLADAVAHGGTPGESTATLAMQLVKLTNPAGTAFESNSTGGGGHGVRFAGAPLPAGTVEDATNTNPIVVTSTAHGLTPGQFVTISGCTGNTAANDTAMVVAVTADTFDFDRNGIGAGTYTGGGTWVATSGAGSGMVLASVPGAPALAMTGGLFLDASALPLGDAAIAIRTGPSLVVDIQGDGDGISIGVPGTVMALTGDIALALSGGTAAVRVTGAVALDNLTAAGVDVSDDVTIGGNLTTSNVTISGDLEVTGDATLGGNVSIPDGIDANLIGTVDGLSAAGLATLFDVDSTKVYSDAVDGSPVKEIATNAGGGGADPNIILPGTLGDQGAGDVDHVVLSSGPADNGILVGSRLRITSGVAQYQERTIVTWNGTDKIAGIDEPFTGGTPASGDTFDVRYDHSHQLDSGNVLATGQVSAFQAGALAQFFTLDSTKTLADAIAGSIVGEIIAKINTRLPTSGYAAPNNAGISSILGLVGSMPVGMAGAVQDTGATTALVHTSGLPTSGTFPASGAKLLIIWTSGPLAGRTVKGTYTAGAAGTQRLAFSPVLPTAPANGDTFAALEIPG